MTMVQIGPRTYVRHQDIVSVSSLTDLEGMSKIRDALNQGRAIVLTGKQNCTVVALADGKIVLTPVSAKTIRERMQAADWSCIFGNN